MGLPGGAVNAFFQSSDGYLWLVSGGNLHRFDGVRFVQMPLEADGKPIPEPIRAACMGVDNQILLRTLNRVLRLEKGRFVDAYPPVRLPSGRDMVIHQTRDGVLWIGSDNHLYRLWGRDLKLIMDLTGSIRAITEDAEGSLWVAATSALFRYRNERLTKFPVASAFKPERFQVPLEEPTAGEKALKLRKEAFSLLVDRQGTLWIGTAAGLMKIQNHTIFEDEETKPMAGRVITALREDRDGNLWVGTDGQGLFRLAKGKWSQLTALDGLSDDSVLNLLEDQEGSLWIGSRTGLDRLRNTPMFTITSKDGLSNNNVSCVLEARDGSLYAFTHGGGITRMKDGAISVFTMRNGLASDFAGNMFESRDGTIWIGMYHGLACFRNGQLQAFSAGGKLSDLYISAICEDEESLLLACNDRKLYRFKNDRLTPYELKITPGATRESKVRYVFSMLRDDEGTLWFAMSAGLYRLGRNETPDKAVRTAFEDLAQSITDDGRGYLWITGRNTPGFSRLSKRDGTLVHYSEAAGARMSLAARILSDAGGDLWIPSNNGIYRYSRPELDAFAEGRKKLIQPEKFDRIDGLLTEECGQEATEPSSWRGASGQLYFASRKGLVAVEPEHMARNERKPLVHIEEVVVDKQLQPPAPSLVFAPRRENVEIHYTAASYLVPSRVRFKYKLEGFDPDWVDAGTRRTAYYTRIPPGAYTFRVIACNNDGLWNENSAELKILQRAPWWMKGWFRSLVVLLLLGAVYLIIRMRIRMLQARNRHLEETVRARTRELAEANDALKNMALTDPLTGLRNRRFLTACMPEDMAQVLRTVHDVSANKLDRLKLNIDVLILMVDIDHFKAVNDQHGHHAGDSVLQQVSSILQGAVRKSDTVARWGGEEFLVIARNTARADASVLPERIRSAMEATAFDIGEAEPIRCTCSIGFSVFPLFPQTSDLYLWEQIVDIADACLFAAKNSGRNAWVGLIPEADYRLGHGDEEPIHCLMEQAKQGCFPILSSLEKPIVW